MDWGYALAMEAEAQPHMMTDAELIDQVDAKLHAYLRGFEPDSLHDAMAYSVFSGGKRIRPLLCIRACQAVGGEIDRSLSAAAAVELIHTFSLVHDDLPAMDDDDLRRGRPTLHKHTNEAMAILAGDAMTALAFKGLANSNLSPDARCRMVTELSIATHMMICGQVYDTMGGHSEDVSQIQQLRGTHYHKTGALIKASICMGSIAGDASDERYGKLSTYADAVGLMFQAVDDLLDVTQTAEKMGKATGKDAQQGKLTYPGLLGIEGTRAEIQKLHQQAIDALKDFDSKADPLREMAERLASRQR